MLRTEEYELFEVFAMLVVLVDLLRLTDTKLAEAGIPEAGRARLGRLRERLRRQAVLELLSTDPQGAAHVLADAFEFDKKLLPAFQRGGQGALVAALLGVADQRPS